MDENSTIGEGTFSCRKDSTQISYQSKNVEGTNTGEVDNTGKWTIFSRTGCSIPEGRRTQPLRHSGRVYTRTKALKPNGRRLSNPSKKGEFLPHEVDNPRRYCLRRGTLEPRGKGKISENGFAIQGRESLLEIQYLP